MKRGGIIRSKNLSVLPVCSVALISNLLLFFIKLYIGLSANSISIYSDGVNNMFDALSAALTLVFIGTLSKRNAVGSSALLGKSEHLVSGILCALVLFSGVCFAYNSAERLMYPTPIWFSMRYFYVVAATAAAKLVLFAVYKKMNRTLQSPAVKVMTYDCLLDFFVTAVTLASLAASATGFFSADAICGIIISIIIIVGAFRMLKENITRVIGYVPLSVREEIEEILRSSDVECDRLCARFEREDEIRCYVSYNDSETCEKAEKLYPKIKEITSVTMKTIKETNENG